MTVLWWIKKFRQTDIEPYGLGKVRSPGCSGEKVCVYVTISLCT